MAAFASIYAKNFKDGETYRDWKDLDNQNHLNVGKAGQVNWVMCLKFTIDRPMKSITLNFVNAFNISRLPAFNYKFTTAEDSSLINAKADTEGEGTVQGDNTESYSTNTFVIEKTLLPGTHYLYFWTNYWDSATTTYNYMGVRFGGGSNDSTVTYEVLPSLVYLADGSAMVAFEICIDNGSSWDFFCPQIANGSSWDTFS